MSALHSTRVSNTCNFNTLCCCDCFSAWRKRSTKLWVLNNPCSRWLWGEGNWVGFWLRGRTGAPTCCSRPSLSCIRTCFWEGEGWRWGMRKGDGGRADNGWCNAQTRNFFFKLTQLHFSLFNFSFTQFSFDGDSCYALLLVTFLFLLLLYSLYKMLYHFNDWKGPATTKGMTWKYS